MKILVIDNGLYVEFARWLGASNEFSRVAYFCPWQSDFVATRERAIGTGFDEFERVYSIDEDELSTYDAFVFPDLYWSELALHLADNYPVWAAFDMEQLELERNVLLACMEELNMDMPEHRVVKGIDAALKAAHDGDFIKIPGYSRGDMETVEHQKAYPRWHIKLREKLGPLADQVPIVIERPIEDDHESGWDVVMVCGEMLYPFMVGYEDKDAGYLSVVTDRFPMPLAENSMKLMNYFKGSPYTQFLSTEFRGHYLIDVTTRCPSPPSEINHGFWTNLAEIVSEYFNGDSISRRLKPAAKYAAEAVIKTEEPGQYGWIECPPELRDHVGLSRGFVREGRLWLAPSQDETTTTVGGIWAGGSSPDAAIKELKRIEDELKMSSYFSIDMNVFDGLKRKVEKGIKHGISF